MDQGHGRNSIVQEHYENKALIRTNPSIPIETEDKYEPNLECDTYFNPGKGTVSNYFDNIDVESQLKNINEIANKCSIQDFDNYDYLNVPKGSLDIKNYYKINPFDKKSKLNCYSNVIKEDLCYSENPIKFETHCFKKCNTSNKQKNKSNYTNNKENEINNIKK